MHQSIKGAIFENNHSLNEGLPVDYFNVPKNVVFSGHIHVPQEIGNVTYVGAPYPIRFGDNAKNRVLLLYPNGETKELYYPCIKRAHIHINHPEEVLNQELLAKDQLKVTLHLHPSEIHKWPEFKKEIKKICEDKEFVLCGVEMKKISSIGKESVNKAAEVVITETKEEILNRFISKEKLDDRYMNVAKEFMS